MGAVGFQLWKNAAIGVAGSTYHLPGLMDISTGALTLHQDLGRWHFTASGMADKYWMPWQRSLFTQYGFGGTVGFAMTPYVNTSTFGSLLQKLVWSERDNPMNFRPHPMSRPPVKR